MSRYQADAGELFVELTGTALNAFDRLVASGDVVLDGYLNIDIDPVSPGVPFVPVLGQTLNIITANTVTGEFDFADVSGMPNGLTLHIEFLSNAVQLQVVSTPFFSADFDNDGDVDKTDLAIWDGAYDLNQLGDADGDNDTDERADVLIWQRQFGSHPGSGAAQGGKLSTRTNIAAPVADGFFVARNSRPTTLSDRSARRGIRTEWALGHAPNHSFDDVEMTQAQLHR